jgi:hypothetical protein
MMTENDEIQSIHIGDYATVVSPVDNTVHENQVNVFHVNIQVIIVMLLHLSFMAGRKVPASVVHTLAF